MDAANRRSPWREPMFWLVAGLPLLVLAAAATTLALAGAAPAEAGAAQVRRIAQVQMEDRARDAEAARRGLRAELRVEPARGSIELSFGARAPDDDRLELHMLHPVDERQDRAVTLQRDGAVWRGDAAPWMAQDRELRLLGARRDWRLSGRLPRDATRTGLVPAVAP